jgi:ribosomal protein S18 acetylase RimI-like enzyme
VKYSFLSSEHKQYVLEVTDTNTNMFELYEKLEFMEIHRKKYISNNGINFTGYIIYSKY